eukprot:scaffold102036_cov18-Tisochrysis_lutea.AAC.5
MNVHVLAISSSFNRKHSIRARHHTEQGMIKNPGSLDLQSTNIQEYNMQRAPEAWRAGMTEGEYTWRQEGYAKAMGKVVDDDRRLGKECLVVWP